MNSQCEIFFKCHGLCLHDQLAFQQLVSYSHIHSWEEDSSARCRYLLLEDRQTGDILIPLSQLKETLKKNSSRLITHCLNRMVVQPSDADFGKHNQGHDLYWVGTFESPKNVKAVIKKEVGEDSSTKASPCSCLSLFSSAF